MKCIMFKSQFADLVRSGTKLQTIRPRRRRAVVEGEFASLRKWEGLPYRSQQTELRQAKIVEVREVLVEEQALTIAGARHTDLVVLHREALLDGFQSWQEMVEWFQRVHGLPFYGVLIKWEPA
jgi:hypothetical protein